MKLRLHYYSIMSGLMAALGSFFGKLITFSSGEQVNEYFGRMFCC